MKLSTVTQIACAGAALGVASTLAVCASTVRDVHSITGPYKIIFVGARGGALPNFTCPPSYFGCTSPTKSSPFTATWCVSKTGNCSQLLPWYWWSATVKRIGVGHSYRRIRATWNPNPGNPSTLTISDDRKTAKDTKLIAAVLLTTCNIKTGACYADFVTYGVLN
jgi:hypothetical protein